MTAGTGTKPVVIIDGGQSGGIAAATLREEGFGGPVLIVSGEPGIPFGKPPLSKTYLRSEEGLVCHSRQSAKESKAANYVQ
jgi:NADPH-dependent 2,4-dienoyl-CoA reductase/sulfur reductase-like enzyme